MISPARSGNRILYTLFWGALSVCQIASCDPLNRSASAEQLLKFGDLPISFEPNRGQAPSDIYFDSRGINYSLSLLGNGASLDVSSPDRKSAKSLKLTFVNADAT